MHIMFQASEIHVRWGNVISLQPPVFVHTHACANMCVLAAFLDFQLKVICQWKYVLFNYITNPGVCERERKKEKKTLLSVQVEA